MFNRKLDTANLATPMNINVKVQQAGLHDATKNYKEFRDAAERDAAKLEIDKFGADNCVKLLSSYKECSFLDGSTRVKVVYSINGIVHQFEKVFDSSIAMQDEVRRTIGIDIANTILEQLLRANKL